MAIKKPIPISFNLDGQYSVQSVCAVIHIDDKNTETLDLSLMQGGEHIAVSPNSTVTARFVRVKDKILISDNVACTVQENGNIHIPIDNAAAHMLVGEIKIEVNIVDENDVLTMQFPLVIRVNNTILADAEISPESEGTIPELLEEAREAAESATQAAKAATEAISTKQDKLTAGQNITITEENVISASSGSNDYTELENKPSINNVTLQGNKSSDDLSLQGKLTAGENITISEDNVISAEGGVTSYNDLTDKPTINGDNFVGELEFPSPEFDVSKLTEESNVKFLVSISRILGSKISDIPLSSLSSDLQDGLFCEVPESTLANDSYGRDLNYWGAFGSKRTGNGNIIVRISTPSNFSNLPTYVTDSHKSCIVISSTQEVEDRGVCMQLVFTHDSNYGLKIFGRYGKTHITFTNSWQELTGGSQIVSGVVNANGTITFTDSEGNSFTTSGSNLVTSGNEQISMGYDEGGFYFLFDDGQEEVNNGTD